MLSFACRRFREEFTPGTQAPHRETCPSCAAYAAALERAAAAPKLPLPDRLRSGLRLIPQPDEPRLPLPQRPLPAGLKSRLRAIPLEKRREPPVWIRSSRWAVAASYFLTVVMLQTLGDPVALGQRASSTLARTWDQTWGQAWTEVRQEGLPRIENAVAERYGAAVGTLESSLTELRSGTRELTDKTKLSFKKLIDSVD